MTDELVKTPKLNQAKLNFKLKFENEKILFQFLYHVSCEYIIFSQYKF